MKLPADEGVDGPIVAQLRSDGHEVWYVAEMAPGIPDEMVLDIANQEPAILITTDKDFGELIFRQQRLSPGIVLIRLAGIPAREKAALVSEVLRDHGGELEQAFTVLTPKTIRIRR